ncbi:hypothetical protein OTK49_21205 [Vibrio coralliirubri]|uniref:hypothetical protein n=1 Tax=Vibrio coralliirubri TaxID=1516159 RepID=UPI0022840295|nr:hypothetical protein [Vibrio coralliirubri]MCY9865039.1 hypothetical protein [Vibrio coralliirubri]
MANMKKQSLKGAEIWIWEADLVEVGGGAMVPLTFICVRLEGAPQEQVWFFKHFYLAEWMEDSFVASSRPREIVEAIKAQGHINLLEDWQTDTDSCLNGNVIERQTMMRKLAQR